MLKFASVGVSTQFLWMLLNVGKTLNFLIRGYARVTGGGSF